MIDTERIDHKWIEAVSRANKNADKILVEKVIRALLLLEGLSLSGIPFVFKGGTSLMLLTNSSHRLSVDIDIIMPEAISDIEKKLNSIANSQGFLRVEPQRRDAETTVPKKHYKFYYAPIHKTSQDEEYVLLDILFEQIPYSVVTKRGITNAFVPTKEPLVYVDIPSAEDLLGDKLTAFAPNTTGIPYYKKDKSMGMEIIKQLYDIGCLFNLSGNVSVIKNTIEIIAQKEIGYRGGKMSHADVLEDIFQTSLCISTRGAAGNGNFEELQNGIKRVKGFIFSEPYHIENAIVSAAKAAYLSTIIASQADKIELFSSPLQIKKWTVDDMEYNILNKLKKVNAEAFFYWHNAIGHRLGRR